jgi:hypothetical protein
VPWRNATLLTQQYPQGLLILMLLRMMPALGERKATTFSAGAVHAQLRLPKMKFFGLSGLLKKVS